ncbi:HNH endonuclease [Candidatus Poriferisodalis sp.]|uniref:HNH endonuclease signature motif containing protein n=1 Tax=Candidatus Poriferisodalis sp. TaxID=3101277 RepID=UPI003B023D29
METDSGDRAGGGDSPASDTAHEASAGVEVRADAVTVSELSDAALHRRLAEIGRATSALAALRSETLRELTRRTDTATAEQTAKHTLRIPGRAARSDVKLSVALGDLDATRSGLEEGTIPDGHAQLIARASTEGPIDEAWLAERAQREGYDQFRRTVARHQAEASSDDGASLLERQRQARAGKIFTSRHDGMVVLNAQFDPVTGARLASVIAATERRLYSNEDPKSRPSHPQRTADSIAMLILEPDAARPVGTSLLVVADYDAVNHQLTNARLSDGTPIPIGEIGRIAADAQVLPAIFNHATGDLRMGRSRRTATELQRAALALRDQGCIGCDVSPDYCRAHHIIEWQHGGRTDYDNLVLVCNDCHHKIHHHGHTVEQVPCTSRYELRAPATPPTTGDSTAPRAPPA